MTRNYLTQRGLSLIETAMGIAVIGLIALPMIRTQHVELAHEVHQSERGKLNSAIGGINQYFASGNSAYPCPADLSLKEGDQGFGKASNCSNLLAITPCTPDMSWLSNGGICRTNGGPGAVIIGGLPFADLKMSQEDSIDFWGNKIIYAVTYHQTNSSTYSTNSGTIRVMSVDDPKDVANQTADGIPDLVSDEYEIFVFSSGETGQGGISRTGQLVSSCGQDHQRYEFENCDADRVFFALTDPNNIDANAYSLADGVGYFDDLTEEQQYLPVNTWFQHEDNAIYANGDFVLTGATRIGVGTTEPEHALHVEGSVQAEVISGVGGGHISSDGVCDEDGSDCFDPEIITGSVADMSCVAGADPNYPKTRGVMRIRYSSVRCGGGVGNSYHPALYVDTSKIIPKSCGGGEVAAGFNASGELQCVAGN